VLDVVGVHRDGTRGIAGGFRGDVLLDQSIHFLWPHHMTSLNHSH
jgi:hypothetical protein